MSNNGEVDETMELILDVFVQETDWKNKTLYKFKDKDFNEVDADIQNIEGRMRVRISDLIKELVNEEVS
ncbi:MAG: hypothetical protein KAQ85_07110 [Thermodesulfovibrionia bacterium]|nr:hypothetical protein [Thermodesulfovibrionia bacterium]